MTLIERIREIAAAVQASYIAIITAIEAEHTVKLTAAQDIQRLTAAKYLFNDWRRVPLEKVYRDIRCALSNAINRELHAAGVGVQIQSDELDDLVLPQYRDSPIHDIDQFFLVELEAARKADFVAVVDKIAARFTPEALAIRARSEALQDVKNALNLGYRSTGVRPTKDGMCFELHHRNDPPTGRAICHDTTRRLYAVASALDALIATDEHADGVQRMHLHRTSIDLAALERGSVAGRVKVTFGPEASAAVFKQKVEIYVSEALFTLISAATAPAQSAEVA